MLQEVIEAQETGQAGDDLRFSSEGWARFQVLMAQADESIKAGKTLSWDEFWARVRERYAEKTPGL